MMYQASRELTKSLFKSPPDPRPWIIWVDHIGTGKLHLAVLKPRYNFALSYLSRWKKTEIVHQVRPISFTNDDERTQLTLDLVDIGIEHVPPSRSHELCYSLGEVYSVIAETWAP